MESSAAIIAALERAPDIVLPLVREVPPVLLRRRPAARKWSAHEHACHLAVVHRIFFEDWDCGVPRAAAALKVTSSRASVLEPKFGDKYSWRGARIARREERVYWA